MIKPKFAGLGVERFLGDGIISEDEYFSLLTQKTSPAIAGVFAK